MKKLWRVVEPYNQGELARACVSLDAVFALHGQAVSKG
ncbi:hypothetical protein imdm_209 [gamma proteobacterium IMCC2047]|nr:hypothetical protein imdm_209 [gamma proteobacterium IMCC2047]